MDREQLRAAARAAAASVEAPVKLPLQMWGSDIYVKRVTIAAALRARDTMQGADTADAIARNIANRLCDETGRLMFDENDAEDIRILLAQDVQTMTTAMEAIQKVDSPGKPLAPTESS